MFLTMPYSPNNNFLVQHFINGSVGPANAILTPSSINLPANARYSVMRLQSIGGGAAGGYGGFANVNAVIKGGGGGGGGGHGVWEPYPINYPTQLVGFPFGGEFGVNQVQVLPGFGGVPITNGYNGGATYVYLPNGPNTWALWQQANGGTRGGNAVNALRGVGGVIGGVNGISATSNVGGTGGAGGFISDPSSLLFVPPPYWAGRGGDGGNGASVFPNVTATSGGSGSPGWVCYQVEYWLVGV